MTGLRRNLADDAGGGHPRRPSTPLPDLSGLRPKWGLLLRLMLDEGWRWRTLGALLLLLVALVIALKGRRLSEDQPYAFGLAGFVALLGLIVLLRPARHALKVAYLLTHGTIAHGTTVERPERQWVWIPSGDKYDPEPEHLPTSLFTFRYCFTTPDGEANEGADLVVNPGFYETRDAGASIAVLYLPRNPRRSAVWRSHWREHFREATRGGTST